MKSPELHALVASALSDAAAGVSDHRALTSAFDRLCEQLDQRLNALFGATAVKDLFARAVHLAQIDFPWLANVLPDYNSSCSAEAKVTGIPADGLAAGLAAVLTHKLELLVTLVGEDLVLPIVQQAWGVSQAADGEDFQ
jgi:hypothetical protein